MSEAPKKSDQQTNIGVILVTIASFFSTVVYRGAAKKSTWTGDRIKIWVIYFVGVTLIAFAPRWNVSNTLIALSPRFVPVGFGEWVHLHTYRVFHVLFLFFPPFFFWLFSLGIFDWIQLTKYQNRLKHLGLKTPTGIAPQVVRVIELENNQKKILVQAIGIDVADFRNRKGAIEASFNAIVQSISVTHSNKQMVEILTSEKELPTLIRFESCQDKLLRPYTFLVGEAMDGFIVADLCEIHHMLVAGATGGGKSVFFKQALVGLLKSSKFIQLYLVDLKRGVDMKPFDALENVEVIKDTMTAISTLTVVVAEMERRFKFLEEKGYTEIVPERDNLDRIVVGVDEASVLFTVEKSSKATRDQAQNARELTDKIAKLGRAAGIHVILATQKVVKETIDTRVQTNINARMCFRVNTVASSMTVLGNKKAAELPDTKGRGIWSVGSNDIIVQVPKLDNEEVIEEVNALTQKFNGTSSPLKQAMLKVTTPVKKRGQGFVAEEAVVSEPEKEEV